MRQQPLPQERARASPGSSLERLGHAGWLAGWHTEQLAQLLLELGDDALELGALLAVEHELRLVGVLGEELAHGGLVRALENDDEVLGHRVLVLLEDAVARVRHLAR
jgi:hypothetical protein